MVVELTVERGGINRIHSAWKSISEIFRINASSINPIDKNFLRNNVI
jgi:hypothetical protein